jgi:hypothetical protein
MSSMLQTFGPSLVPPPLLPINRIISTRSEPACPRVSASSAATSRTPSRYTRTKPVVSCTNASTSR